ncbi:MAG: hypothetical protein AABX19_03360 [Nanoarchaeota archaeon]
MGFWSNLFFGENKKKRDYIINADRMIVWAKNIKDELLRRKVLDVLAHIKIIREEKPQSRFGNTLMNNMGRIIYEARYRGLYIRICKDYVPTVIAIGSRLDDIISSLKPKDLPKELYDYLKVAQREIKVDYAIIKKYKLDKVDIDKLEEAAAA